MENKLKNKIYKFLDYYHGDYDNSVHFSELVWDVYRYFPISSYIVLIEFVLLWGKSRKVDIKHISHMGMIINNRKNYEIEMVDHD